jgi:hypothetical protein
MHQRRSELLGGERNSPLFVGALEIPLCNDFSMLNDKDGMQIRYVAGKQTVVERFKVECFGVVGI